MNSSDTFQFLAYLTFLQHRTLLPSLGICSILSVSLFCSQLSLVTRYSFLRLFHHHYSKRTYNLCSTHSILHLHLTLLWVTSPIPMAEIINFFLMALQICISRLPPQFQIWISIVVCWTHLFIIPKTLYIQHHKLNSLVRAYLSLSVIPIIVQANLVFMSLIECDSSPTPSYSETDLSKIYIWSCHIPFTPFDGVTLPYDKIWTLKHNLQGSS